MIKKIKITQEDLDAFHRAVEGTKPMRQEKILLASLIQRPIKSPQASIVDSDDTDKGTPGFSVTDYLPAIHGEEFIAYKQESISNKTLRKLGKGQYNIDAILDLHGFSVEKASSALASFLQHCFNENKRIILIIHGKGHEGRMPLLKNKVNHWLREADIVLAFCSATSAHGGRGATYVLLKRLKAGAY